MLFHVWCSMNTTKYDWIKNDKITVIPYCTILIVDLWQWLIAGQWMWWDDDSGQFRWSMVTNDLSVTWPDDNGGTKKPSSYIVSHHFFHTIFAHRLPKIKNKIKSASISLIFLRIKHTLLLCYMCDMQIEGNILTPGSMWSQPGIDHWITFISISNIMVDVQNSTCTCL